MGTCGGSDLRYKPVGERVDLVRGPAARAAWRRRLGSDLSKEALFADGKILTDFAVFIDSRRQLELMTTLWLLYTSSFGLEWSDDDQDICADLAEKLEDSWEAYLQAPQGFGNFLDVREWEANSASRTLALDPLTEDDVLEINSLGTSAGRDKIEVKQSISKDHQMYEFAVAAMWGMHVAVVCHTVLDGATSTALRQSMKTASGLWEDTFWDLSLLRCLQNESQAYEIPPYGTAYSPPTRDLSKGRFDMTYRVEDFCPTLFAQMRQLCGITKERFQTSACNPEVEFIEFGSNSKSGEAFFFSNDGKFLLKTMTRREAECLMRMLPDLLKRVQKVPHSLLGRYLGLFRVSGEEVDFDQYFFVMMCATQHDLPVTRIYDLKGSRKHRNKKNNEVTHKDQDFHEGMRSLGLPPAVAEEFVVTHSDDVDVLVRHSIMDYSLLIHVHDRVATQMEMTRLSSTGTQKVLLGTNAVPRGGKWDQHVQGAAGMQGLDVEFGNSHGVRPLGPCGWRPGTGIWSADGRYLYTMCLIDMLVPFNWYPKMQVAAQNVISCGKGDQYSRVHPRRYAERQKDMVRRICFPSDDDDDYDSSDIGEDWDDESCDDSSG